MKLFGNCLKLLEIGSRQPLLVRREHVSHLRLGKRVLFASDLHLKKDGPRHIVDQIIDITRCESPDIVLLGGDLIDSTSGAEALRSLVGALAYVAPVGAVAGNHDRWIGAGKVRAAVLDGGGRWLEDRPLRWTAGCTVYGSPKQAVLDSTCHVLCTHHPDASVFSKRFDLTFSGHLHGGQFVFYQHRGRLYPGAFLYPWNGLRFERDGKTLLVSRGVRDTLPLRWNCPREVLIVDV